MVDLEDRYGTVEKIPQGGPFTDIVRTTFKVTKIKVHHTSLEDKWYVECKLKGAGGWFEAGSFYEEYDARNLANQIAKSGVFAIDRVSNEYEIKE